MFPDNMLFDKTAVLLRQKYVCIYHVPCMNMFNVFLLFFFSSSVQSHPVLTNQILTIFELKFSLFSDGTRKAYYLTTENKPMKFKSISIKHDKRLSAIRSNVQDYLNLSRSSCLSVSYTISGIFKE